MEVMKRRLKRYLRKERKQKETKWSLSKQKFELKNRSGYDIVKGTPGPRFQSRFIKNESEEFVLYI